MNLTLKALNERGFIKQCSNLDELSSKMNLEPITFYLGIDVTASSMHIGHLLPIFLLRHLQDAGHIPIILLGGGTTRIGDPTGKSKMRKILSQEEINKNTQAITSQIKNILNFKKPYYILNNADWLLNLNYIDFLVDIGIHFSVNRMLSFETYKNRMQTGLSFIEFNYQILQSYDFYKLAVDKNCILQIGGDDQWGNIVAGIDLVRRKLGIEVFGLTCPLLTKSDGSKMGKTEKGALFLSKELYSAYDFYQYFRNVDDRDLEKLLLFYTFLSIDEIKNLLSRDINKAKDSLAYEITAIIHGSQEAQKSREAARALFSKTGNSEFIPTFEIEKLKALNLKLVDLITSVNLSKSKSDARRLIQDGGVYINEERIKDIDFKIEESLFLREEFILRVGKKKYLRILINS